MAKKDGYYLEEIPENRKLNYFRDNAVRKLTQENYNKIIDLAKFDTRPNELINSNDSENTYTSIIKEGERKYIYTTKFERNKTNRDQAIALHGLKCKGCEIDFKEKYGEWGEGFIHVHHIKPLASFEEEAEVNPATDLIPVCPNCHSMIHRKKDSVLTIEKLKEYMNFK